MNRERSVVLCRPAQRARRPGKKSRKLAAAAAARHSPPQVVETRPSRARITRGRASRREARGARTGRAPSAAPRRAVVVVVAAVAVAVEMPRKKESFIDKKNAVTYALMARPGAEEDAASDERGGLVVPRERRRRTAAAGSVLSGPRRERTRRRAGVDAQGQTTTTAPEIRWRRFRTTAACSNDAIVEALVAGASDATSAYSMYSDVTFVMGPNGPVPRRERLSREKRRELRELGFDPQRRVTITPGNLRLTGEGGGHDIRTDEEGPRQGCSRAAKAAARGTRQNERAGAQRRGHPPAGAANAARTIKTCSSERTSRGSATSQAADRRRPKADRDGRRGDRGRAAVDARARQGHHGRDDVRREGRRRRVDERHRRDERCRRWRSIHWSPYDRVRVVNADP